MSIDLYNCFTTDSATAPTVFQDQALGNVGANSSRILDLGAGLDASGAVLANPDIGMGKPVFANIVIDVAGGSAGSSALSTFELHDSADGTNFTQLETTPAIAQAVLVAGWKYFFAVPPGARRYLKIVNTVSGENFTSGSYKAWLDGEPVSTF